jgi:hypothetical protein
MSGYRDVIDNAARGFEKHSEYTKANRAYNKDYGALEDYQDGYQQGFEAGYNTGYDKRSFDATIPSELRKRGVVSVRTTVETSVPVPVTETPTNQTVTTSTVVQTPVETTNNQQISENTTTNAPTYQVDANENLTNQPPVITSRTENPITARTYDSQSVVIPTETELVVELLDDLNTDRSREGDKFTAKVISPYELSGAVIEGRVSKIQKPGRIKRRAEMLLSFDRIVMQENNRWSNFNAVLTEVLPTKGDNVKRVDTEGTAVGKNSYKEDAVKVGATTGTGMVIGAIAGGPVGAAVGAGIGAAFGVGVVVVERGKHIKLNKNQQLRIKTVYETNIR